jgi:RimJ/RimL family protein N-acetyltransferase
MIKFKIFLLITFLHTFNLVTCKLNAINENEIHIKPLTQQDKNIYLKISYDERVKYESLSYKKEKTEKEQQFKYYLMEKNILLKIHGIFIENKCVGYVGFFKDNARPNTLFIYYAVDPTYWKKGIGTLAVKNFLKIFKDIALKQNFNLIKATIKINNIGSQRVLEKNNFKPLLKKDGTKLVKLIDNQSIVYEYELKI